MLAFLYSLLLIAAAFVLLAIRLFFGKDFVQTHTHDNEALRKKGIHCARTQDALDRRRRLRR